MLVEGLIRGHFNIFSYSSAQYVTMLILASVNELAMSVQTQAVQVEKVPIVTLYAYSQVLWNFIIDILIFNYDFTAF